MCNSIQCCCKKITTKESSTQVCKIDNGTKKEQSFCEFLKSQPAPEWTKQQKSNKTPCCINKNVVKSNVPITKPRCGKSDICEFLQSQPIPEWIKKSEKTPENRCEKILAKPPKDVCKISKHTNNTVDKRPENHCCDLHKYDAHQETTMDIHVQKSIHCNNRNSGFDDCPHPRQNAACENFNDDQNTDDDNCTQKFTVKIVCPCTKTAEKPPPQETCGSLKPYAQKSKNDREFRKYEKNENYTLPENCGENRTKPIAAVSRPCPCGCHSD